MFLLLLFFVDDEFVNWYFPYLRSLVESGGFIPLKGKVIGHGIESIQKALEYHEKGASGEKPVVIL